MYDRIKNDILGKKYSLSIAFISAKKSREINKKYRKKDRPTNVLSFALSKNEGEILLCKEVIRREAKDKNKNFGKNYTELVGFLVIHGMLHLKGMRHGSIMEKAEKAYDQKYFYGHRRRVRHSTGPRARVHKRRKNS